MILLVAQRDLLSGIDIHSLCESWNVQVSDVNTDPRIARMRAEWPESSVCTLDNNQRRTLLFLYLKRVLAPTTRLMRQASFSEALGIHDASDDESKQHVLDCSKRLMHLLKRSNDLVHDVLPPSWQSFASFMTGSEWHSFATSWVFFRDVVPDSLVQHHHHQLYGLCSLQAPAVVLHYAMCKVSGEGNHRMIDLTAFMLRHMTPDEIWTYVSQGTGGSSIEFLKTLSGVESRSIVTMCNEKMMRGGAAAAAAVANRLIEHGPALISLFSVNDDFQVDDMSSYVGTNLGSRDRGPTLLHAMALVGFRTTATGETLFLVQNWWTKKQFFECDLEYLSSRSATLSWLATISTFSSTSGYPTHSAVAAESGGGCETYGTRETF